MKKIFFILFLFISATCGATNYYVDTSGNNSNDGLSPASAWKTISKVQSSMASFNAGDFILFKGGQYFSSGQFTISRSGSSGNPITFGSYGTGRAIFVGNNTQITALFYMNNRSYLTFRDIQVIDTSLSPTDRTEEANIQRCFYIDGSGTGVKVINCDLSLVGVGVYTVSPDNLVDSSKIWNTRMIVNTPGGFDDYGANGIICSSSGNTFTHNLIFGCWAESFDFQYDGGTLEFFDPSDDNTFMYNDCYDNNGFCEIGSSSGGTVSNVLVAANKLINNESQLYAQTSGPFVVAVSNLQFFNNTIIESVVGRLNSPRLIGSAGGFSSGDVILTNNVYQLSTGIDVTNTGTGITHTYNAYKLSGGSTVGYSLSTGEITPSGTIFTSTTGVAETWNYTPSVGSALLGAGTNVGLTQDFAGNAVPQSPYLVPSIGCLERVASARRYALVRKVIQNVP